MDMEHGPEQEQDQEKYSFMQEVIKEEQAGYKKIWKKIVKLAGKGLVFGIAASLGFFAIKPWTEDWFQKNPDEVEIPQDEETETVEPEGNTEPVQQEFTIENYREMSQVLLQVATQAQKSVVQLTGIQADGSWLTETSGEIYNTTGLIVADNGLKLLILADYSSLENAQSFWAEFADHTQQEAVLKQKDGNTDMAVFSVDKNSISEGTWDKIQVAVLGNSNALGQGMSLIAVGSPFGYEEGIGYGMASSVGETQLLADGEYKVIVTDLPQTAGGSGVLFDLNGNVMGIIDTQLSENGESGVITAWGISSMKAEIELMSNGKEIPYIGIKGTMITPAMAEEKNMPTGLYVNEVEVDSPAMQAGIQSGDIITAVGEKEIETLAGYHSIVMKLETEQDIKLSGQRYGAENYVDITFQVTVGTKQ